MAFANNKQCTKLMFYAFVLYLSISSLSVSADATMDRPIARSLLPFQKKNVVITNYAVNKEVMNVHCSSSENDLGLKHISYHQTFTFHFKVNWKATTKFRCHVTWRGGGDHWFTAFSRGDGRDKCGECVWHVYGDGGYGDKPLMFYDRNEYGYHLYDWDK
ncbi:hypothetical protein Bca4012_058090 [Brassica carinata]